MDFSPADSERCGKFCKVFHGIKGSLYQQFFVVSTGFNRVRIYFTANNLFTISDFVPGMDPEASSAWAYPFARTYSFGLNVQF